MIKDFADKGSEDVYNGVDSKAARKVLPIRLHAIAARKLDLIEGAVKLIDLRVPPANRLEALKSERAGQHSIRINDQYRICFRWTGDGAEDVEITDYH